MAGLLVEYDQLKGCIPAIVKGAASGRFYENHVVMELVKGCSYAGGTAGLSFYRDADAREVDLVVEEGPRLHPLEVKKTASPRRPAAVLGALGKAVGFEVAEGASSAWPTARGRSTP